MQNSLQIYRPSLIAALELHLEKMEERKPPEEKRSVFVMSEMPVRPLPTRDRRRRFVPDMTVAFDADREHIERDNGYSIEHQGKPPALVLEVASASTGRNDYTIKRNGYARFGVPEYWRTDPSGGEWHDVELAGDRLDNGLYTPIPIERVGENELRGYSDVLSLWVCWEYGVLRFFDPVEGYLLTHHEEREGRLVEREGRLIAEARVRYLEEQLRRLRT